MTNHFNEVYGMELTREHFAKASGLFNGLENHLSIQGVLLGVIKGRVFLSKNGETALLCNDEGYFLGGNPNNKSFLEEVSRLFAHELLPQAKANGELDYVLFYPSDELWKDILEQVLSDLLPIRSGRMSFTHTLEHLDTALPQGVFALDSQMLAREDIDGMSDVVEEIEGNWSSMDAFLKSGFGCVAIQNTQDGAIVMGWCLTDWVVGTECEIGIETDEQFQRQGWGHKTAKGALILAKERGMTRVGWQCWGNNIGSIRTARSVGFELLADFPVLFGWNDPLNNLLVNGNMYMCGDAKYGVDKDYERAAKCYAKALDQGRDWNGDAALYWNTACLFYLIGETARAVHYYELAVAKGWVNSHQPHYHKYVYREADSEHIVDILAKQRMEKA